MQQTDWSITAYSSDMAMTDHFSDTTMFTIFCIIKKNCYSFIKNNIQ